MLEPLKDTAYATTAGPVVAVLTIFMFRSVIPFMLLVPMLSAAEGFAIVTRFCDQSATEVAVAPTIVTVAVPSTVTASKYVPGRTVTVGILLAWAALTAALMAVNCPDPSAATVIAVFEPLELFEIAAAVATVGAVNGVEDIEVVDGTSDELREETALLIVMLWAAANPIRAVTAKESMERMGLLERKSDGRKTCRIGRCTPWIYDLSPGSRSPPEPTSSPFVSKA
jgi:hypothetical protein